MDCLCGVLEVWGVSGAVEIDFEEKNSFDSKIKLFAVWFTFRWVIKKFDPIGSNFMRFKLNIFLDIQITNYLFKNVDIIQKYYKKICSK